MADAPISIQGFALSEMGVAVEGTPSFPAFQACLDFVLRTHKASGWWLADIIVYGESRPEWSDKLDHLIDHDHLTEASIRQYRYLGKAIPPNQRVQGVGFGHHAEVASLPPAERVEWLEQAKTEGWTQRELRHQVKVAKRQKLLTADVDRELFRVVVVEPSWGERAVQVLSALPVGVETLPDAALFLWSPVGRLLDALDVMAEWGFDYRTMFVWHQVVAVPTNYQALQHELLLVGTKGDCPPADVSSKSVQTIRRRSFDQGKPTEFLDIVEKMYPTGPYCSIGGLEGRMDWALHSTTSFGQRNMTPEAE